MPRTEVPTVLYSVSVSKIKVGTDDDMTTNLGNLSIINLTEVFCFVSFLDFHQNMLNHKAQMRS